MKSYSLCLAAVMMAVAGCNKGGDKSAATTIDSAKMDVKDSAAAPAVAAVPAAAPAAVPGAKGANLRLHLPAIAQLDTVKAPPDAKRGKGVGHAPLWMKTERNPKDDDNIWTDKIDLQGDGVAEDADLVVSDDTHTAYAYAKETVQCKDGTVVQGAELMAVYRANNTWKQPAGSGWYATALTPGQCGATQPSIWGARFDASGKITAEGFATIETPNGDLMILGVPAKK
jgi:hypothetical protein